MSKAMFCIKLLILGYIIGVCHGYSGFSTIVNASVLGYPGSMEAELYRKISRILLHEPENVNGISKNEFCLMNFNSLTFDRSSGHAVYSSLIRARHNFRSRKVAVAIGPFMEVFTSTDYVITNQMHIVTSPVGQNAGMMDPAKVLSILPEAASVSVGVASVVGRLGWKDVAFLAQDDFSPVLTLNKEGVQVWPIRLPNDISSDADPELQRNLIELRQSEKQKFILHSNDRNVVHHVLKAAHRLHLLHHNIGWFVTYPDFEDLVTKGDESYPGILFGLQLLREEKIPNNISHLINMTSGKSRLDLGLAVDVVGLLKHILLSESLDCNRERLTEDYVVPPEAFAWQIRSNESYSGALGQYVWDPSSNRRTNFSMDVLMYKDDTSRIIGSINFENTSTEVYMSHIPRDAINDDKFLFGKKKLKIATKLTDPFVIKRGSSYFGFSVDLLQKLANKVGFKFELIEVDEEDESFDSYEINGLVKALMDGNASMAVGALEVTAEREKLISFSYTILSSTASILIKKAESTNNFFQFLGPFSTDLWCMILVFIMVATASLFVMSRYDPTQIGSEQRFDFKESAWYSINIVIQGSTDYSPQTTSMRAIIAFFWFCVLIIDAAYTANLAAYLTLQQMDDRIKTVHDLAAQTQLKYGVANNGDVMKFFKNQKEDPYERMWAFMKLNNGLMRNTTEVIRDVKSGKLAFISDGVTNGYYANQHCGIESIEQNFGSKDFSLGFPRGAPYLDDINQALLELKEEGVLDTLKEKWWETGKNCTGEDDTRSISQKTTAELELTNMIGVFIVLGAFIVIAILVHIAEKLFYWRGRKNKTKENLEMDMDTRSDSKVLENHFRD